MPHDLKLFSGTSNLPLAEEVAEYLELHLGEIEIRTFSDGEIFVKYQENIRGADVYIIQSTNSPASNLLELFLMLDAARKSSARRVTAVVPYYGYCRQDRKDQPRVSISAKLMADLITRARVPPRAGRFYKRSFEGESQIYLLTRVCTVYIHYIQSDCPVKLSLLLS